MYSGRTIDCRRLICLLTASDISWPSVVLPRSSNTGLAQLEELFKLVLSLSPDFPPPPYVGGTSRVAGISRDSFEKDQHLVECYSVFILSSHPDRRYRSRSQSLDSVALEDRESTLLDRSTGMKETNRYSLLLSRFY